VKGLTPVGAAKAGAAKVGAAKAGAAKVAVAKVAVAKVAVAKRTREEERGAAKPWGVGHVGGDLAASNALEGVQSVKAADADPFPAVSEWRLGSLRMIGT
jgi:hypothetical protein